MKRICETRWSSKHYAVEAVALHLDKLLDVLEELRDEGSETIETRVMLVQISLQSYHILLYHIYISGTLYYKKLTTRKSIYKQRV